MAAIAGFALAIVLILSLETIGYAGHHHQHSRKDTQESASPAQQQHRRNLQKTDSSGLSEQQLPVEDHRQEVQWKSSRPDSTVKVGKNTFSK